MKLILTVICGVLLCHSVMGGAIRPENEWAVNLRAEYVPLTRDNAEVLKTGDYLQNTEEISGQFEGDIILTDLQRKVIAGIVPRTGIVDTNYRWPQNRVPYVLTEGDFNAQQQQHIRKGLDQLEAETCLTFVPRTTETDYVYVTGRPEGCYSYVGRIGGPQQLNLQLNVPESGCFRIGTIMHEFIHAIGFYHMQSATERDNFVKIVYQHIQSGTENNFETYATNVISNQGIDYDVKSVMHYGAYAFSKDGYATIVPNDISLIRTLGQRTQLAQSDIIRINRMYSCPFDLKDKSNVSKV